MPDADPDDLEIDLARVALAASVLLALVSVIAIGVAIAALTDWRWALLWAGAIGMYGAVLLAGRAAAG